jgi:hypothetical protein
MMRTRVLAILSSLLVAALLRSSTAQAATGYASGAADIRNVLHRNYNVPYLATLDVTTSQCSGAEDTAIFALDNGGSNTLFAFNDDFGGGFCSHIAWKNITGAARDVMLLISTFAPNSPAQVHLTVIVNGTTTNEDLWIGGIAKRQTVTQDYDLKSAPARIADGGRVVDTLIWAIDVASGTYTSDDDSGPGYLSRLTAPNMACGTSPCWFITGEYTYQNTGVSTGKARMWISKHPASGGDFDSDGVPDELENTSCLEPFQCGLNTSPNSTDTDSDGLTDGQELMAVPAASLAGGDSSLVLAWEDANNSSTSARGADALTPDLFVQVDFMATSGHSHSPIAAGSANWTSMVSDVAAMFNDSSWTGRSLIRTHIDIHNQLVETPLIGFEHCPALANYSEFYSYKSNPGLFDPLKASTHHYAILGHNIATNCAAAGATSGRSEELGSDSIVTLGSHLGSVGTIDEQHGAFDHELGHTLSLNHNGNAGAGTSCVHSSAMNYRYTLGGWGNGTVSSIRRFAYSRGQCDASGLSCGNTCVSSCVPSAQASPKTGCETNNGSCDCDKSEWSLIRTDFQDVADELTVYHYCSLYPPDCDGPSGSRDAARARALEPYFLGDRAHLAPFHRLLGQRRRQRLVDRGLIEGVDFVYDPGLARTFSIE